MATKVSREEHGAVARHPPSIGVLGSGRLANTTSTYSSCSRSSDAFRPATPTGPLGAPGSVPPASEAASAGTARHRGWQHPVSTPTFNDVLSGQSPLGLGPGKGKVGESLACSGCSGAGWACYLLSSPEDFGGDHQAGSSAGRKRESLAAAPTKPHSPCRLPIRIHTQGCSASFP